MYAGVYIADIILP